MYYPKDVHWSLQAACCTQPCLESLGVPQASFIQLNACIELNGSGSEPNGTSMGTPNSEPQEYSRNVVGIYLPGYFDIAITFLPYSWGSLFGLPIQVPLEPSPRQPS